MSMVKGLSRRVVTVRFPDAGMFEQAIFMVREDAKTEKNGSVESVLREACRIARDYEPAADKRKRLPLLYSLLGGGAVGFLWFLREMIAVIGLI